MRRVRSLCAGRFCFILSILAALAISAAHGESRPDLTAVVSRVHSFYRGSPGIVARFTQILASRTLASPQQESGTLYLKAPGKMRWEYSHPRGKLAVCDGSKVFLYLPEDREVLVGS